MTQGQFFGRPELPRDQFQFDQLTLYVDFDRKERIEEWRYEISSGVDQELEKIGGQLIGLSLKDAWQLSGSFEGLGHAVYWQLGRLLGLWPQPQKYENSHLICRCFGIYSDQIVQALKNSDEIGLTQIRRLTRASAGCGSCRLQLDEIIQGHCDKNASANAGKLSPHGLTPIQFLLKVSEAFDKWQKQYEMIPSLRFMGAEGYTIFAQWNEQDAMAVKKFEDLMTTTLDIKLNLQYYP